jgi:signal transduction histidine kinase
LKFESLRARILIWFGSSTLIILIIFSLSFYFLLKTNISNSLESKLYKEAIYVKDKYLNKKNTIPDDKNITTKIAIFKNKRIVQHNFNFKLDDIKPYLNSKDDFILLNYGETIQGIFFLNLENNITIISYEKDIDNQLEDFVEIMLIIIPFLFFILIFLAGKVIDKILIPINNLTKTANEITINNFNETIPFERYNDEISKLTKAFNTMILRLQKGVENLDRFNSDVSHELKTPLTVIKGEIELSLLKKRENSYYENSLNVISFEINQMEKMIDNLLLLTKYTKGNIKNTFEEVNLDAVLLDTIYSYDVKLKEKNIKLQIKKIEHIKKEVNLTLIKTIFSNLIDNAIKYSKDNKKIEIELFQDDKICFIIKDEGFGIDENKLNLVTEKFYRVDESRNKKIEGFGLGLSIVKNSIELHQGKLIIESILNQGTTVKVIL